MNEMNLDWNDLNLFLAVARKGGLSPAAKTTLRSPATLGRRMRELERSLGREFFVRHERGYEMTEEGRKLLGQLSEIEAQIIRLATKPDTDERPLVKISAGTWTTLALLQRLDEITGSPADVRIRFVSTESILDIPRREVVIGFRNRRPTENTLAGRKLARVEFAPYASPDAPQGWIKVTSNTNTPSSLWLEQSVGDNVICEVSSPRNCLDLALAAKGIALLPTFIGDAQPTLHRRGGAIEVLTHDQWIVTHQDDRQLPEVRRTIDRLCGVLEEFNR